VHTSLLAKEDSASKQVDEMEEYLGILQTKKAMIQLRITQAEEQVKYVLDSDGMPEVSLSDTESTSSPTFSPPHTSDYISP
jgi:hypothetical protein